jgi:hypothetical protein
VHAYTNPLHYPDTSPIAHSLSFDQFTGNYDKVNTSQPRLKYTAFSSRLHHNHHGMACAPRWLHTTVIRAMLLPFATNNAYNLEGTIYTKRAYKSQAPAAKFLAIYRMFFL